jgi:tetratricopeptide (TPR) repeat protein
MTEHIPTKLLERGFEARREHRIADAREHLAEAVELCRKHNDRALLARALTGLGQIERDLHNLDVALRLYQEAADLYRSLDDLLLLAHTVRHVGDILRNQGQLKEAALAYTEAIEIYRSQRQTTPLDLANAIRGYALLKGKTGETEEAWNLWKQARDLYASVNVKAGVEECNVQIASLTSH